MFNKSKQKIIDLIRNSNYTNTYAIAAAMCNRETFSDIKNCNYGKKMALCGAGPSLNKYTVIEDCVHVALNRALLKKEIDYQWFIADDWDGINFFQKELVEFDGLKFFGHIIGCPEREIPESFRIKCRARRYYNDSFIEENGFRSRFACDIDKLPVGMMPNIALSAMQILLFSNPSVIYLVGCDASQGHYIQPESLSKERIRKQEEDVAMAVSADSTVEKWKELKRFAEVFYPDTKIISINPVGLKGLFKDEYQ